MSEIKTDSRFSIGPDTLCVSSSAWDTSLQVYTFHLVVQLLFHEISSCNPIRYIPPRRLTSRRTWKRRSPQARPLLPVPSQDPFQV